MPRAMAIVKIIEKMCSQLPFFPFLNLRKGKSCQANDNKPYYEKLSIHLILTQGNAGKSVL